MIKAIIVFGGDVEIPNDFGETPGLLAARSSKGEGACQQPYRVSPASCLPLGAKTVSWEEVKTCHAWVMLLQHAFPASSCSRSRHFASSIGFVLIALDEFLFCDTEVQEERLARTPPFSDHQVRHCRLTTG